VLSGAEDYPNKLTVCLQGGDGEWRCGFYFGIPAQTRVADQKPFACSNFASSHGGRVGALWTIIVDHSSRGGTKATSDG
jgi:hypothetical protein